MQQAPYIHFDEAGIFAGKGIAFFDDPISGEPNQPLPPQPEPTFPADGEPCTQEQYDAAGSWTTFVDGTIVIGSPPPANLAEQAAAALAAGLTVTSTKTPARNGIYPCDPDTQSHIQAEMIAILINGAFADGGSTVDWPDITGASHSFDIASFKALASAIGIFAALSLRVIRTNAGTLPSASATIA